MTKDDIILMADASGIAYYGMGKDRDKFLHYLEAFAALVAAAEREACETAVEDIARKYQKAHHPSAENVADACAYAIRARGEKA
jgi:hypothetical protein